MLKADGNSLNGEQLMHAMSVDDGYRVERVLSKGAGGVTELVTIDGSGPFVRKKIPREQACRMVWAALAECESRYLPRIWATYEMPERFVVVLDFVPGESLERYMANHGPIAESEACELICNVCEAVSELHERGVIHRDISPANIVVSADGAHLVDLGIARIGGKGVARDTAPFGTPGFAAPEQYGFTETDVRSDIYSIGKVLGYMLTGVSPNDEEHKVLVANENTFSDSVRDIVRKACAFEPSARFQSVREMSRAIAERTALGAQGLQAPHLTAASSASASPVLPGQVASTQPNGSTIVPAGSSFASSASARISMRVRIALIALAATLVVVASLVGFVLLLHGAGIVLPFNGDTDSDGLPSSSTAESQDAQDGASGVSSFATPTSDDATSTAANMETADASLELVDSGWYLDSQGYVCYAVALRNASESLQIDFPAVEITGRDESGSVLFTSTQVLNVILPGETLYYGGLAGNGGGSAPATVEFNPVKPDEWNVKSYDGEENTFTISGLSEREGSAGIISFTGEVTAESLGCLGMSGGSGSVCISVILRDDAGKIVYGCSGFANLPEEGQSVPFEVSSFGGELPSYATMEAYAMAW